MKIVIVGGVAAGMSCAARLRRLDEHAQIIVFEKDEHVSFANCGLPYHIGGVIKERARLLVQTPDGQHFALGSGFTDAQRASPPAVGTLVTSQYRDRTASGLPKFASFLRQREID